MFIETINAIATTAIAFLVAVITWRQLSTDRSRLRHELFDRRYEIYERFTGFLAETLNTGKIPPGAEMELLRQTKRAYFIFGGDAEIRLLISEIHSSAVDLVALVSVENGLHRDALQENLENQRRIKDQFNVTLNSMEKRFGKYLCLNH